MAATNRSVSFIVASSDSLPHPQDWQAANATGRASLLLNKLQARIDQLVIETGRAPDKLLALARTGSPASV
jgi:hypothetical protein